MMIEEKIPDQARIESGAPLNIPEPNISIHSPINIEENYYRLQLAKLIIERDYSQEEWQKTVEILQSTINHGIEEKKRLLASLNDNKNHLEKIQTQHNESIAILKEKLKGKDEEINQIEIKFNQTILNLQSNLQAKEKELFLKEQILSNLSFYSPSHSPFSSFQFTLPSVAPLEEVVERGGESMESTITVTNEMKKEQERNDSNSVNGENNNNFTLPHHTHIQIQNSNSTISSNKSSISNIHNPYLGKLLLDNQELREKVATLELKLTDYQIIKAKLNSSQVIIKRQLLEIEAIKSDLEDIKSLYKFQLNNICIK